PSSARRWSTWVDTSGSLKSSTESPGRSRWRVRVPGKPSTLELLATLPRELWQAELDRLTDKEAEEIEHDWLFGAREEQRPPEGDWRVWLYLAGRGAGKTRSGAEWVRAQVALGRRRIALVAPTAADARDVIVEGESGILAGSSARETLHARITRHIAAGVVAGGDRPPDG